MQEALQILNPPDGSEEQLRDLGSSLLCCRLLLAADLWSVAVSGWVPKEPSKEKQWGLWCWVWPWELGRTMGPVVPNKVGLALGMHLKIPRVRGRGRAAQADGPEDPGQAGRGSWWRVVPAVQPGQRQCWERVPTINITGESGWSSIPLLILNH
ncbi:hypothetical protein NDU88_003768 [Pleurodeles waltl]|uniref:Uncharacterized protein n=1 Tax=Pleurodeles waltl TaxID=8319 RepID=A0AAV7TPL3_PLEWA|nr:hypothetical protein NDU88_003768 [Pleurodeles waltl]